MEIPKNFANGKANIKRISSTKIIVNNEFSDPINNRDLLERVFQLAQHRRKVCKHRLRYSAKDRAKGSSKMTDAFVLVNYSNISESLQSN